MKCHPERSAAGAQSKDASNTLSERSELKRFVAAAAMLVVSLLPLRTEADDLSPKQIYLQALATMHALPEKPFLRFTYVWAQLVRNEVLSGQLWSTILQTSTGRAHMVRGSDGKIWDNIFDMRPDLLIGHPKPAVTSGDASFSLGVDIDPAEKLPTIAVVTARPVRYAVSLLDEAQTPGCTQAYHLGLVPISNPDRNNLRDLWVDTATFQVCKARASWQAGQVDGRVFPITFTLYFNSRGFVTDWAAEGAVRNLFSKASYIASGFYQNVKQLDASPIAGWPPQ
jgi:hypothetical protein